MPEDPAFRPPHQKVNVQQKNKFLPFEKKRFSWRFFFAALITKNGVRSARSVFTVQKVRIATDSP